MDVCAYLHFQVKRVPLAIGISVELFCAPRLCVAAAGWIFTA